jgi:hypothetical protein
LPDGVALLDASSDPPFKGRIFDFRIYSAALDSAQIQASYAAGADADW